MMPIFQDGADEIAGGEDGNMEAGPGWRPIDEKAAKEFVLGLVEAEMHLGDGAPEHNHATQHQAGDRQLERGKELVKVFEHFSLNFSPSPRLGGAKEFVVLSGCVHSSVCFVVSTFHFRFSTSRFGRISPI
jgi:hypothetical protein